MRMREPLKYAPQKIRRILLISTRQIGDVLLTTPLIRSLRRAYPQARIEVLVFRGKQGIIEGNPDIDAIIEVAEKPRLAEYWRLLKRLLRRYDLAVATLSGDRPILYAWLAAPRRIAPLPPQRDAKTWWKRGLLQAWTPFDDTDTPTVVQNLQLADVLAIPRVYQLVPPQPGDAGARVRELLGFDPQRTAFAVLHPLPMWRYKRWPQHQWIALAHYLRKAHGLQLLLSGGPGAEEQAYLQTALRQMPPGTENLAGKISFAELAWLLRRARLFVGPDTAVTHLAAACATPTVALFGPTNPVKWGPWPAACDSARAIYQRRAPLQQQANVILLQGEGDCVPCHQEGCERHRDSFSRCLDELALNRVMAAADSALRER